MNRTKGFTLIEFLLCFFLLSLVLSFSSMKAKPVLEEWRLEIAAREVAFQIRMTKMMAIRENISVQILCAPYNGGQVIVKRIGLKNLNPMYTLPPGIQVLNQSDFNITFNPKGTPSIGRTIRLSNDSNRRIAIVISPVTGRVVINKD